jgi:predicted RNA binding protein YcfA (HicA-like mRNA interferase family)
MYNSKLEQTIPVPMHNKDLKTGTLRSIINQADSSEEKFLKLK